MSISELHPHTGPMRGPAGVLAEIAAELRDLDATFWATQPDDELVAIVELAEQARSALAAVQAGAVAEADARDLAKQRLRYGSTGDWLTHLGGLRRGDGRRIVARAHALTGHLTDTREAMAAGRVSPEQADVIVASVEALPTGSAVRSRGQAVLLEHTGALDATELATTGRHLVRVVDPDAEDRRLEKQLAREERAAHQARFLALTFDGAGGVRVTGRGSAEDGALLRTALLPLTVPAPTAEEPADDPRDHGARMWDALVATAQHALDTQLPPQTHGSPTRLTVTTALEALQSQLATASITGPVTRAATGDGIELSATTIRRLACDAEIIPTVLGTRGEPLDVGRARRLVTPAIWLALVLRDRHCAFPGCTRPPIMCHTHHVHHWALGGGTSLSNLVLLCGHHHRTIHDTPWKVRISPHDHQPEFLPPPKPGTERKWIRHRPRLE